MSDKKPQAAAVIERGEDNVDKIRDILFGSQQREFERRIGQTDARVQKLADELKADLERRTQSLESTLRRELEKLNQRLTTVNDERTDEHKALDKEFRELARDHSRRLTQLGADLGKEVIELKSLIEDQARALADSLQQLETQLTTELAGNREQLVQDKVGRLDLADFFEEVALKLRREFDLPG